MKMRRMMLRPAKPSFKTFDLDFAILRVKLKCGKVIEVSNQFGNIHVVEM